MDYQYEKNNDRSAAYDDKQREVGECTFSRNEKFWIIDHTFVDPKLRGQGVAENLVLVVVDQARSENVKIVPLCPFAKKEFDRKSEYKDILY